MIDSTIIKALDDAYNYILNEDTRDMGPTETQLWNDVLDRLEYALRMTEYLK